MKKLTFQRISALGLSVCFFTGSVMGQAINESPNDTRNMPMAITPMRAIPEATEQYVAAPVNYGPSAQTLEAFRISDPNRASTSVKVRNEVVRQLPYRELSSESQQKVRSVLKDISMYRRLPVQTVVCEEDLFEFITRHPDVLTNLWEVMNISKIRMKEVGPDQFYLEDNAGTRGMIECLYRGDRYLLIHVLGSYEGAPFPKQVKGSGLLVLQYLPTTNEMGQQLLSVRMDAFMQIENMGVDALAKTFGPLVGKVGDHNFVQTVGFLGVLSRTVCYNGDGVRQVATQLKSVRPEVSERFGTLSMQICDRVERQRGPLPVPMTAQTESTVR
ncbi:MAG: hypothetical protein Q4D98_12160 [Planctomycetia bacterium]|nr:hypothetical protein [Planctomycetia bacterium]